MSERIVTSLLAQGLMIGSGFAGETVVVDKQFVDVPPLEADRPDVTESPITVPKGMWQLEMTTAGWSRDDDGGGEAVHIWSFGQVNMKYGFSSSDDIQFGFDTYTRERAGDETADGFSDVVIRWKHNLLGLNDESPIALAVMPYVKVPTGTELSNEEWEGGIVIPAGVDLTDRIALGAQIEPSYVFNDDEGEHELGLGHTVAMAIDLVGNFGTYVEYVGFATENDYEAAASTGVTYDINANFRLDAGAVFGLNDAAEDLAIFTGLTYRF